MNNVSEHKKETKALIGFVYAISDPRNPKVPRYVGKTKSTLRQRLGEHIARAQKEKNKPLSIWLNSLLDKNLLPVIYQLEACEIEKLQERETCWILFFKPLGLLTNVSNGQGTLGMKLGRPSEKNIQITIARNKLPKTESQILRMRSAQSWRFKPVINLTTGEKFESIADAERKLGVYKNSIKGAIKNGYKCKGCNFSYV